jgi:hypothetical protein
MRKHPTALTLQGASAMLFIDNKYTRIYFAIIERAKLRTIYGYTENHHIIPKSLGGDNSEDNLVRLSAREHFLCHLLLTKMTQGHNRSKMALALLYLTGRGKAKERRNNFKNSRLYEKIKKEHALFVSKQKKGCKQPPRTKEARYHLSKSKTGKLNPNYKYEWITPWGTYESSRAAAKKCPESISAVSILNFCQKKNNIPISYLSVCRSKGWIKDKHIGKTPAQLGFAINTFC